MTDLLAPATVRVAVDGTHGLAEQLLSRVLAAHGATIVDGDDADLDVVVLVEPTVAHWERAQALDASVVLLCDPVPDGYALVRAIEAGARGALPITCEGAELMAAVRRVAAGDVSLSRAQTREVCSALRERPSTTSAEAVRLSPREAQILRSIEAGELVKQTARSLGISPRTVENTQRLLFRKLGVRNRAQAIARAYALALIEPLTEDHA